MDILSFLLFLALAFGVMCWLMAKPKPKPKLEPKPEPEFGGGSGR